MSMVSAVDVIVSPSWPLAPGNLELTVRLALAGVNGRRLTVFRFKTVLSDIGVNSLLVLLATSKLKAEMTLLRELL